MLARYFSPSRPRVVLSPAGLMLRVAMKDILIPWREIEDVFTTDQKAWTSARGIPFRVTYRQCTIVRISRQFYDRQVHVASLLMRGPGWDHLFVQRGNSVEIALHHEQFSVAPEDVREPIEGRWREFRGQSHPASRAEASAVPHAEPPPDEPRTRSAIPFAVQDALRMGSAPRVTSTLERIKLAVPLIGILVVVSNALGVWETASQEEARLEREREANAEERRQEKAERDKRQKAWDDHWKKFDEDMRRVHPYLKR
jgi:hypothetical protein